MRNYKAIRSEFVMIATVGLVILVVLLLTLFASSG